MQNLGGETNEQEGGGYEENILENLILPTLYLGNCQGGSGDILIS